MLNDASTIRIVIDAYLPFSLQSWTFWKAHVSNLSLCIIRSDHDCHSDVPSTSICVARHVNSGAKMDVSKNVPK